MHLYSWVSADPPGYPLYTLLSVAAMRIDFVPRITLLSQSGLTGGTGLFGYSIGMSWESSMAWRVNHMCCVFGVLAAAFVCASVMHLLRCAHQPALRRAYAGVVASYLFAFSPLVWEYSIGGEVFSLNNFLCSVLVYLTVHIATAPIDGASSARFYMKMGAFVTGLMLANQHTSLLLAVFLIPSVAFIRWADLSRALFAQLVVCGLAGLSPYLYLVWAGARSNDPVSWGDTSTLLGFIKHVARSEFGTLKLGFIEGSESALQRTWIYAKHTSGEMNHLVFPCALIGCIFLYQERVILYLRRSRTTNVVKGKRKDQQVSSDQTQHFNVPNAASSSSTSSQRAVAVLALAWIGYLVIWHGLFSNLPLNAPMPFAVHSRFWMQPNIILCVVAGVGAGMISTYLIDAACSTWLPSVKRFHPDAIVLAMLLAAVHISVKSRFGLIDRSADGWIMHSYGEEVLRAAHVHGWSQSGDGMSDSKTSEMPLLLAHTDLDWNPTRYLLSCEAPRPEPLVVLSKPNRSSHFESLSDVESYNFQLMPYPWFMKKISGSGSLQTSSAVFPPILPGVSTSRKSEQNAQLVSRFLNANLKDGSRTKTPSQGRRSYVHLDMQAINDVEIGSGGAWRDFTLVPWGLVFRATRRLSLMDSGRLHADSIRQLRVLQCESFLGDLLHYDLGEYRSTAALPSASSSLGACDRHGTDMRRQSALPLVYYDSPYDLEIVSDQVIEGYDNLIPTESSSSRRLALRFRRDRYPPGSWEWAAASVYFDAHNQLGLVLLSFAIDYPIRENPTAESFILVIDRLYAAATVLGQALVSVQALGGPLSSSLHDLEKNVATCYMQLHSMLDMASRFRNIMAPELARWDELVSSSNSGNHGDSSSSSTSGTANAAGGRLPLLHNTAIFEATLLGPDAFSSVAARAVVFLQAYIEHYPGAKDTPTYVNRLAQIRSKR